MEQAQKHHEVPSGADPAKKKLDNFYAFHSCVMGPGKWVDTPGHAGEIGSRKWIPL